VRFTKEQLLKKRLYLKNKMLETLNK